MELKYIKDIIDSKRPTLKNSDFGREASVVLPLIRKEDDIHILFEVRSRRLKMQPGDICFPGGGIDSDESPKRAAVREACEELLIKEEQIELLGEIDGTIGPTGAPMWAFAAVLSDYENTFSENEVEEVFTVPISFFLENEPVMASIETVMKPSADFPMELLPDKENYKWKNRVQEMPFYIWEDYVIWGATARILRSFLTRF